MSKKKSSNGAATKRPEGVKVIPLSFRDQYNPIDKIRSLLFFVVRRRLDEGLMRRSLDRLIREHVPILGARLETASSGPDGSGGSGGSGSGGGLEYHLPEKGFPEGYKLFEWSSETVGKTFAEAGVLPPTPAERKEEEETDAEKRKKKKKIVEFYPSVPEMEARWTPSSWPRERRQERPGCALLLVHLTRYADATVVSTNLPHAVSDQKGYAALVEAWIEVIKGLKPRPFLDLPPGALMGDLEIPVAEMKKRDPRGVYRITSRKERARTALGFALEVVTRPREVRRTLVLDEVLVSRLRDKFNREIAEGEEKQEGDGDGGGGGVKVTNGDVITAILLKFGHLDRQKPKMITHSAAVNLRGRHPSLPDSPSSVPYLHNAVTYLVARFPVSASAPRARDVARRNREATLEAVAPPRAERGLAVMREMARRGYMIHICEPGELSFALTNWCGAWRGIDFSAAVEGGGPPAVGDEGGGNAVNGGEGSGAVGDGEPVTPPEPEPAVPGAAPLVFGHSLERSQPLQRFNCQVMCKADGGYWVDFSCSSKNMALIEALLEKDPGLDTL
ncbi:hypothetical protein N3K66_008675 [Trichothecium roseum]|uniref:Uncharacterized protein n=1 Tax=Trichothecium roseum TaxID=47278 RepID=A0ACC0UQW9_9HYPO|nr:hypothetical protein N3K66_008675 [Trichothecium roseum]